MPYLGIDDPGQLRALLDAVLTIESDLGLPGVLHRIVEAACSLTDARYGALGVLDEAGKGLSDFVQVGIASDTAAAIGHLPEGRGVLALLIRDPKPLRLDDLSRHPESVGFPPGHPLMRSLLGVPLRVGGKVFGHLYLAEKRGAPRFSDQDEALAVALSATAGIAVHNARLYAHVGELSLAADRERIARDLHDTVIQRLFATGLSLQSSLPLAEDVELRSRVEQAVAELDDTIRQVRTTIFALEPPPSAERGVRARILEICNEAARGLGADPEVRFSGAIDRLIEPPVATELISTLREALSNVARHAEARSTEVELSVVDGDVHLRIADDGIGASVDPERGGHGLLNMARRAEALGGSFALRPRAGGGTEVSWRVPLRR